MRSLGLVVLSVVGGFVRDELAISILRCYRPAFAGLLSAGHFNLRSDKPCQATR
jgi:hypothetical protein